MAENAGIILTDQVARLEIDVTYRKFDLVFKGRYLKKRLIQRQKLL